MTQAEIVARVVNGLKALTKDTHISKRYILSIAKAKAKFLMSQKLDEGSLFKEDGIISTIECFKMKQVDVKACDIFEFRLCNNLMKSCVKLPEGLFGKTGAGIVDIMNIDGTVSYDYVTPRMYSKNVKRKFYNPNKMHYYYIKDGYLYLPDSMNEIVEIRMFALDKTEVEDACDCKDNKNNCTSKWETEFVCPDRFVDLVIRETLQEVASIYRTSVADENPNLDENIKSATTA